MTWNLFDSGVNSCQGQSYACLHLWLPQKAKYRFSIRCTVSFRQDMARTELGKRNRKIQKKNRNKNRKKCQNLLKETRPENNK